MKTVKTCTESVDGVLTEVGSLEFTEKEFAKFRKYFHMKDGAIIIADPPTEDDIAWGRYILQNLGRMYNMKDYRP